MRHIGGQCHCALFSEVRILGDATFTQKPKIANQNGERGTVAACDVRARVHIIGKNHILLFILAVNSQQEDTVFS